MRAEDRHKRIRALLKVHPMLTVQRLTKELGVSPMTIRRDLDWLTDHGMVTRVHGGVTLPDTDRPLGERQVARLSQKQEIAQRALAFISPEDTIALDSGSTTACLAEALLRAPVRPLTVVTHALNVASILMQDPTIQVTVSGGDLRGSTASLVGPMARQFYEGIRVQHAFIAAVGLTQEGLSNSNFAEAEIKRAMMAHAEQVFVLADSEKLGQRSVVLFAPWQDVTALVTDPEITQEWRTMLAREAVAVYPGERGVDPVLVHKKEEAFKES